MSNDLWRWVDPDGQQRGVRLDELRAALAGGHIAPNTPVWRSGWKSWQAAHEVPELTSSALSAANGLVPNIPPPPLAMVAMQHAFEAKAGDSFAPPPVVTAGGEEPPPPPRYVPQPVKANSIPPAGPSSGRLPSTDERGAARMPSASGHSGPSASTAHSPMFQPSLPTTIGLPPPPELLAMAASRKAAPAPNGGPAKNPMIEELSGSMLLEEDPSSRSLVDSSRSSGLPAPTNPVLHGVDEGAPRAGGGNADLEEDLGAPPLHRRPDLTAILDDLKEMRAGRPPKNKLLIGVLAVVSFAVVISLLALVVSLFSGSSSDVASSGTAGSASGASSASPPSDTAAAPAIAAATAAGAGTAAARNEPKIGEGALSDCALAGEAHVVSPRAFLPSGVEAIPVPGAVALGFGVSAHEGVAVTVDPGSIGITTTVKTRAAGDARRMTPVLERGKLSLVADLDKKLDKLGSRRVVATNPPVDLGVAEDSIVWAPHGQSSYAKLFPLEGEGTVEALRGVPLGSTKGIAVAFRRGNAVYVGTALGEGVLAPESLSRITGLGQVGSPSITTSGGVVVVAWSDRASAQEPWQVRWTKLSIGGTPDAPRLFPIPDGGLGVQAMSPSVAGLGGGRFLLAWSEGTPTHQVRAQSMNADGTPSGAPLALSAAGINAGQPQMALLPDGRGVVAFLAANGSKVYEVHATPVACAAK